ncbi:MAG: tyrosine-type recombinase/integrase [Methylococcales bacterium]
MPSLLLQPSYSKIDNEYMEHVRLLLLKFDRDLKWKYSERTVVLYLSAVKSLYKVVDDLIHPSSYSFTKFLVGRRGVVSTNTINIELSAFRAFYKWLYVNQHVPENFSQLVPSSRRAEGKKLVRHFTEFQMGQILAQPDLDTWQGFRDHVIMRLIYECGLRSGEVISLDLGSYSEEWLYIKNGKGRVDRYVPFSSSMKLLLDEWVRLRRKTKPGKKSVLFVTHKGVAFKTNQSIWVIVNRYIKRSTGAGRGYEKLKKTYKNKPWTGYYPHLLRASMATHMIENGCDIISVQKLLGHKSPNTTAHYVGVNLKLLKKEHAKHPRNKMLK